MEAKEIDAIGHKYYKLSLWIIAGLTLLMLLLLGGSPYWNSSVLNAILISAAFSFLTSIAYEASWKGIAKSSPACRSRLADDGRRVAGVGLLHREPFSDKR